MGLRRFAPLAGLLMLAACATTSSPIPAPPAGGWTGVAVDVRPVGLGLPGGARLAEGVDFAGGFELRADAGSPFHGLSDLKAHGDWFYTVSDAGGLFRFRIVEEATANAPSGVLRFEGRPLTLPDGRPIVDKVDGDAEGLAVTRAHGLLVSFERNHRIWTYGPARAPVAPAARAAPDFDFPLNDGMEAISIADDRHCEEAPDARPMDRGTCLRVAGESGGVWDCAPQGCVERIAPPAVPLPDSEYRITGMDRDPEGAGWFVVERLYRPPVDVRARVRRMAGDGSLGPVLIELKLPGATDNFEGITAERRRHDVRLYLLSDDNGNRAQRTLLLAFDVRPAR